MIASGKTLVGKEKVIETEGLAGGDPTKQSFSHADETLLRLGGR